MSLRRLIAFSLLVLAVSAPPVLARPGSVRLVAVAGGAPALQASDATVRSNVVSVGAPFMMAGVQWNGDPAAVVRVRAWYPGDREVPS